MSTRPPELTAGTIAPSSPPRPARNAGHNRFRSGHWELASRPLSAIRQQSVSEHVSQPVAGSVCVNGHALDPTLHDDFRSHSHSHESGASSLLRGVSSACRTAANEATGPTASQDQGTTSTPTNNDPSRSYEMAAGSTMALPWIAISWYSLRTAQAAKTGPPVVELDSSARKTSFLTAITIILASCCRIIQLRRRSGSSLNITLSSFKAASVKAVLVQTCALGLLVYASLEIGGFLVAVILLLSTASGLTTAFGSPSHCSAAQIRFGQKKLTATLFVAVVGVGLWRDRYHFPGYIALLASVFTAWLSPIDHLGSVSPGFGSISRPTGLLEHGPSGSDSGPVGVAEAVLSVVLGAFLILITLSSGLPRATGVFDNTFLLLAPALLAVPFIYLSPACIRTSRKLGLATGIGAAALLCAPPDRGDRLISYGFRGILAFVSFFVTKFDDRYLHLTARSHNDHIHTLTRSSKMTRLALQYSEAYPLLYSILRERDSRRIFYFMSLNFSFMLVQLSYGFLTGSLGLLSDSIHMFFDCLALIVGLCAAVMSKWPPSPRFPHGYSKVNTLSGFANGIFLMIISIEIIYEAIERLSTGSQLRRIGELLIVSIAGLAVNVVGIFVFDHGHGHDHRQGHTHEHENENMHGIFLHIVADTLGSVAVVISTVLVHYSGWPGFDPVASCVIAILIFASAIPLVRSTARSLLLALPADVEYNVRDTLAGVSTLRGVVGYTVPKFWLDDIASTASGHDHADRCHGHDDHHSSNGHTHSHTHDHSPSIKGVIHVIASRGVDLEDVRRRTSKFLLERNMDVLVQVEREGDGRCWCGGK